jgi:hypothetical protein
VCSAMSLRILFLAVSTRGFAFCTLDKNDGDVSETSNRVASLLERQVLADDEGFGRVAGRA